jgi:threonine dehydrogenase-like Zn-dependent dehydrogenase
MEQLYGHRTAGIFGYSHLTGAFDGCQAEYVRVPFGDRNCLKIKPNLTDEQTLFLSDVLCTGWHGNELAKVKTGDRVVVWGCGPVGLAALSWAKFRGASRIIAIDNETYRLATAKKLGCETINFSEQDVISTIQKLLPGGPDACIDCVGFRFPKSEFHKNQFNNRLETDALDIINEMVVLCRKNGRIALIGDYFGYGNQFPIGALMEKGIRMRGSQVFVQKYWQDLLGHIEAGKYDPSFLVTHILPFEKLPEAYRTFSRKQDNSLKIVMKTAAGMAKR